MLNFVKEILIGFWPYLLIAGMIGFFFVTILAVGCLEKHRIHDFKPMGPDLLQVPSPYFQAMNDAARQAGFQLEGVFGQYRRNSTYRCCIALWLSPDGQTLLSVGGGKLAGINYRKTLLLSRLGGKVLVTMDEFGSTDLSGTREIEALLNADLAELNTRHLQRLALSKEAPSPFSMGNLLQQYEEMNRLQVDKLIHLGLAKYLDAQDGIWRYSPKGAWVYAVRGYLKGMKGAQGQAARLKKKRPGS